MRLGLLLSAAVLVASCSREPTVQDQSHVAQSGAAGGNGSGAGMAGMKGGAANGGRTGNGGGASAPAVAGTSNGGAGAASGGSQSGGAGRGGSSAGGSSAGGSSAGGSSAGGSSAGGTQAQAGSAGSFNYQTDFGLTESPVSENGVWHNKGLVWTNVVTSGGLAYGTQGGHAGPPYDDSYAILSGWPPDQYAEGVIHIEPGITGQYVEVEILLRWSDGPNNSIGYECNLAFNGQYGVIGRWPGYLGTQVSQYTSICPETASPIGAPKEGDKLAAQIVGYTITSWIIRDGVKHQLCTGTDTTPGKLATGSPGIGFYSSGAPSSSKFSFTSFSAHSL